MSISIYSVPGTDNFQKLQKSMQGFFDSFIEGVEHLFSFSEVLPGILWGKYLNAFPAGEQQVHNCINCRKFIDRFATIFKVEKNGPGGIAVKVFLKEFVESLADEPGDAGHYKTALTAVADEVVRQLSDENPKISFFMRDGISLDKDSRTGEAIQPNKLGVAENVDLRMIYGTSEKCPTYGKTWHHLALTIPEKFIYTPEMNASMTDKTINSLPAFRSAMEGLVQGYSNIFDLKVSGIDAAINAIKLRQLPNAESRIHSHLEPVRDMINSFSNLNLTGKERTLWIWNYVFNLLDAKKAWLGQKFIASDTIIKDIAIPMSENGGKLTEDMLAKWLSYMVDNKNVCSGKLVASAVEHFNKYCLEHGFAEETGEKDENGNAVLNYKSFTFQVALVSEVSASNMLFVNREIQSNEEMQNLGVKTENELSKTKTGRVASSLLGCVQSKQNKMNAVKNAHASAPNEQSATAIDVLDFIKGVLPNVRSAEIWFGKHEINSLMSVTRLSDPTAPSATWIGNPFAWSYHGGHVNASRKTESQLFAEKNGGCTDGIINANMTWNDHDGFTNNWDYDLYIDCKPYNETVYHGHKKGAVASLDVDKTCNHCSSATSSEESCKKHVENIIVSNKAKNGDYRIFQRTYDNWNIKRVTDGGYVIEIILNGEDVYRFQRVHTEKGRIQDFATIRVKDGIATLLSASVSYEHYSLSNSVKKIWGLQKETWVNVSAISWSPNYWEEACNRGQKHLFFYCQNCLSDEMSIGSFNEFLIGEIRNNEDLKQTAQALSKVNLMELTLRTEVEMSGLGMAIDIDKHFFVKVTSFDGKEITYCVEANKLAHL